MHVIKSTYVDNWVPILLLSRHFEFVYLFFVHGILIEPGDKECKLDVFCFFISCDDASTIKGM